MRFPGGVVYKRRDVPRVGTNWMTRMVAWLANELGNVERALGYAPPKPITSDYAVQLTDGPVLVDATSGAVSVTLPAVGTSTGVLVTVKKVDASANAVTVVGTVDGAVNPTLAAQYNAMTVYSSGTAWFTLATV